MPAVLRSRIPEITASMRLKVTGALRRGSELIADDAKERVPVETGRLRDAIHVEKDSSVPYRYYVVAGDTEAFYGHLVELGTTRSGAEPFLVPATEARMQDVVDLVNDALEDL